MVDWPAVDRIGWMVQIRSVWAGMAWCWEEPSQIYLFKNWKNINFLMLHSLDGCNSTSFSMVKKFWVLPFQHWKLATQIWVLAHFPDFTLDWRPIFWSKEMIQLIINVSILLIAILIDPSIVRTRWDYRVMKFTSTQLVQWYLSQLRPVIGCFDPMVPFERRWASLYQYTWCHN